MLEQIVPLERVQRGTDRNDSTYPRMIKNFYQLLLGRLLRCKFRSDNRFYLLINRVGAFFAILSSRFGVGTRQSTIVKSIEMNDGTCRSESSFGGPGTKNSNTSRNVRVQRI